MQSTGSVPVTSNSESLKSASEGDASVEGVGDGGGFEPVWFISIDLILKSPSNFTIVTLESTDNVRNTYVDVACGV